MDIRILRYFLTVAREENISNAAEFLHITQPTLSRQLIELEEELGTQLLVRGNRKRPITLTEEGMLLRKRAEELVALADKIAAEFNAPDEIISGDIYIGCGETDAFRSIAKTAENLKKIYPHIRYHLFSGNAEDIAERLDKGLLDFGILIGSASLEKYDYLRLPSMDKWGLLMRKDSPLSQYDTINPQHLDQLPLLVSRQSLHSNEFSGWSGRNLDQMNIVATYNLIYNAAIMVDEGFGYALTLDKLVNTTGTNLCFKPLEPKLEAHLDLVMKKYQFFSKAAKKFLEQLQKELL